MAEEPKPKTKAPLTKYVICRRIDALLPDPDPDTGDPWVVSVLHEEGVVEHHGAVAAIRQHVAGVQQSGHKVGDTYVAIPESNWTECDISSERPPPILKAEPTGRRAGRPITEPQTEVTPESRGVDAELEDAGAEAA